MNQADHTRQLALPLAHDEGSLRTYLCRIIGKEVSLVITDNSTSMLSVRRRGDRLSMRIHRIFLDAGRDILEEIGDFVGNRTARLPLVREFLKGRRHLLKAASRRGPSLKVQGSCHDLKEIYDSHNAEYFNGEVSSHITWGARSPRRAAKKRTLGSYSSHTNVIRINPLLDKKSVPKFFVAFIVYHEMLHALLGTEEKNGRRSVHTGEFRKREKFYRDYEKAVAWEKRNRVG